MNRLVVNVGDVLGIGGRRYVFVPDKQGGAALKPAITMSVAEILAAHRQWPPAGEEFEAHFGDLPSDGEG